MGESYEMILQNATDEPWHFAVYQKYPMSPGLTSVAWQVRGIPPKTGSVPSEANVNWNMDYGICIAKFDKNNGTYTGKQIMPANLGKSYKVDTLDGDIPSINPSPVGQTSADMITLKNLTGPQAQSLTMGFTVSNNIIAVQDDVGGNQETIYRVHPTYYVACYRHIVLGQLVDTGVVIGPCEVKYEGGARVAKMLASKDAAGNYHLKVVETHA